MCAAKAIQLIFASADVAYLGNVIFGRLMGTTHFFVYQPALALCDDCKALAGAGRHVPPHAYLIYARFWCVRSLCGYTHDRYYERQQCGTQDTRIGHIWARLDYQ